MRKPKIMPSMVLNNSTKKKSKEKKKSTAEKKKREEDRSRKKSQEATGNVRKMLERLEERNEKEIPYLRVPGPETGHVPVPRGGSGTGGSSSSSGRRTGTSPSSISKFRGGEGALGIGGEFPAIRTLYGRDACQTGAAHICAAAVPPDLKLSTKGGMEDDRLGIGRKAADGERAEFPGEYRNLPGLGED